MMDTASGSMTGLGLPIMYGRLAQDLVEAAGSLTMAAGRQVAARIDHALHARGRLDRLAQALLERGYAPSTVRKYCACTARFVGAESGTSLQRLRRLHVCRHLDRLRTSGLGNGSLRLHLCAIRTVFDRVLGMSLTEGLRHVPRPPRRPVADEAELMLLWRSCRTAREALIMHVLNRGEHLPGKAAVLAAAPGTDRVGSAVAVIPSADHSVGSGCVHLFASPVRHGPISLRTFQRHVARISARARLALTCTAIRLAAPVRFPARTHAA